MTVDGLIYVVSYLESFARAASRALTERGMNHRVIELSWGMPHRLEPVLRRIFAEKLAGLILWTPLIEEDARLQLMRNSPTVICAGDAPGLEHSCVKGDYYRGVQTAIQHLHELGHRHIAHVSFSDTNTDRELADCYQIACRILNSPESASMIWQVENSSSEGVRQTMQKGHQRHPEVTALFCVDHVALLALEIFDVPREISVVGMDGLPEGMECRPPLTTVAFRDPDSIARLACADLMAQIHILQAGRPAKPPAKIFLAPDLILRESTRALVPQKTVRAIADLPARKKIDPAETWRKIYPFLAKNRSSNWFHLDLSTLANHSMTRHHGWLGAEPLEHFPPGLRSIHGVPFQVLDGMRNEGRAVVTFRSPHAVSARDKELPTTAKLKLNSRAKALYFLHGCGHAKPVPFAEYVMHYQDGSSSRVPLIPLGPSPRLAREQLGDSRPNLQDWWPNIDFDHQDFPHAHHVTVYNPSESGSYERFLYTLEWINPRPDDEIGFIEVRADPEAGPTLALIAVTALLDLEGR
jgi:DNA-binding LacI/PurR family transcriptional regulator